ncbi:MAG: aminodeoxychorismate lyase [Gammaproteobacteria bacterium]|nr:aminodeoxychorismate lyase [Gammaproteobacteria bacterium]
MMLINGTASTQLDARDRGLHYGDGVFTTLRVRDGTAALWEQHAARMQSGCRQLGIALPDTAQLHAEAQQVCAGATRGVLKMLITRGAGGRGYAPPRASTPTRMVALYPWPEFPATHWREGVAVRVNTMRLARNPQLAGIKHLNRLEQVLARAEWDDADIAEGLMLDDAHQVIEATAANIFVVRDGALLTPQLHECGVAGVMRAEIMRLSQLSGQPVQECALSLDDVRGADEMFLTNSVIGVWPVRKLDTLAKPVGPRTQAIAAMLEQSCPAYA